MKLMGKVTIQIFDAKTGKEIERREGHNILTNAAHHLANGCPYGLDRRTWGALSQEVRGVDWSDIFRRVFGGILIFEDTIAESPAHLFEPLTNYPCGYASMDGQDTSDNKAGTYNGNESGPVTGGYRWVYDFQSSSANGNWKTVCLTSAKAGYGYISGQQDGTVLDSQFRRDNGLFFRGGTSNYLYFVSQNYYAFTIYRLPLKPFDIPLYGNNINGTPEQILSCPSGARVHIDQVANKIHVLTISDQTLTITTYNDEEDLTDTTITTLTLNAGVTIPSSAQGRNVPNFCIADGFAYLSGSNKILKVDLANAANVTEIDISSHGDYIPSSLTRLSTGDIYCYPDIIDANDEVHHIGAGAGTSGAPYNSLVQYNNWVVNSPGDNTGYAASILTTYLATIYNLSDPVPKSANITAKISYTLTVAP